MDQVGCRLCVTLLHICAAAGCGSWFDRNVFPFLADTCNQACRWNPATAADILKPLLRLLARCLTHTHRGFASQLPEAYPVSLAVLQEAAGAVLMPWLSTQPVLDDSTCEVCVLPSKLEAVSRPCCSSTTQLMLHTVSFAQNCQLERFCLLPNYLCSDII